MQHDVNTILRQLIAANIILKIIQEAYKNVHSG